MSSATFVPSASSDSGSSSSLTPTANTWHSYEPMTSAGPSSSLFSSEESKFITDSLSSAESFDPFTIGAPGFKVPSLLPTNIISPPTHEGVMRASQSTRPDSSVEASVPDMMSAASTLTLSGPSSGLDLRAIADQMRSRSASGHNLASKAQASGHSPQQQQQAHADPFEHPAATHRLNNWNLYGYRGSAPGQAAFSSPAVDADGVPGHHNYSRHASFSGAPSHFVGATSAGYGKNRAWQIEQLSFLEAQANRVPQQHQHQPHPHEGRRSSTSVLLSPTGFSDYYYQQPQHQIPPYYNNGDDGSGGLAMLGSQFPSSHNFPPANQQHQFHQDGRMHSVNPTDFTTNAMGMFPGHTETSTASSHSQGLRTPKASKSRTPTTSVNADASGRGQSPNAHAGVMSASPASVSTLKRTSSGSAKPLAFAADGPSAVMLQALANLAPLDLDLDSAVRILPARLHQYYLPHKIEKKYQPHLEMLRRQHIQDELMDDAGREIKRPSTKQEDEEEEEKEKKAHTLLTTEEKKANHIASEQKRRANIRKGYELLCDIVPALREALEREAKRGKHDNESSDENEDTSEAEDNKAGKKGTSGKNKRKGGNSATNKKIQTDDEAVVAAAGGCEVDGEKIDGRAGPRSEAVVLMKSLEHISMLLERFRALLGRRNRARLAVARSKGWDGLVNNQSVTDDIESMLAAKLEEWFSNHTEDGDDDDEYGDDEDPDVRDDDDEADEGSNADVKDDMHD